MNMGSTHPKSPAGAGRGSRDAFLSARFSEAARHRRRLEKVKQLERSVVAD